jgi:hypothetical protein
VELGRAAKTQHCPEYVERESRHGCSPYP